jgi:hypothetical protein
MATGPTDPGPLFVDVNEAVLSYVPQLADPVPLVTWTEMLPPMGMVKVLVSWPVGPQFNVC